jgi:hypothetical protein
MAPEDQQSLSRIGAPLATSHTLYLPLYPASHLPLKQLPGLHSALTSSIAKNSSIPFAT